MDFLDRQFDEALSLLTDDFLARLSDLPLPEVLAAIDAELKSEAGVEVVEGEYADPDYPYEIDITLRFMNRTRSHIGIALPH